MNPKPSEFVDRHRATETDAAEMMCPHNRDRRRCRDHPRPSLSYKHISERRFTPSAHSP
jgi:hypothetical protein